MARRGKKWSPGCGCLILIIIVGGLFSLCNKKAPDVSNRPANVYTVAPVYSPPPAESYSGGSDFDPVPPGKQHVRGYTRKDGTRVRAYNRNRR